jgi:penicillin-binding protein 2
VIEEAASEATVTGTIDIEPAVLNEVRRGMLGVVVDKRGTGHKAALPEESGILVGGKTGTAQVASRESGSKKDDHAWFAGYAPADKPQIAVVAIVENGGHGGAVAAPIVHDVMAAYFGIEPVVVASVGENQQASNAVED